MATFGRKPIYTRFDRIDASNILQVMGETFPLFVIQRVQSGHLFDYYKGKQKILDRKKTVRDDITNKIIVNHANEIVSFKVSYLLAEPIKYTTRSKDDVGENVNALNEYMYMESKESKDKDLADWFNICGVSFRMVLPRADYAKDGDEAPFELYTLSPMEAYVIRSGQLGRPVVAGVYMITRRDERDILHEIACVYTDSQYFEVDMRTPRTLLVQRPNPLGRVPIFEWVNNKARIGSFEIVETMLDAINALESNRLDATEQAVQALLMFKNCEIDEEKLAKLKALGAVNVKAPQGVDADIKPIVTDMKQADQQVLLDSLYKTVLAITGLPAQPENVSNSSNNGAAFMSSGWYAADARAKDSEKLWRESETEFLKLVLKICRDMGALNLKLRDFEPKFTRRNYEDILSKSQTLVNMLSSGIHPKYAIEQSGLFYDPTEVYLASVPYLKKYEITSDEWGNLPKEQDPDNDITDPHNHDESTSSQKLPRGLGN